MHPVNNPIQAVNEIFYRPNAVLKTLESKDNWSWIPFIVIIAIGMLGPYLYFGFVDFAWYKQLIIDSQFADLSPSEQASYTEGMTPASSRIFTMVAVFLGTIIINGIIALYLNLATRSDENHANGFMDWYGLTWWVALPTLLNGFIAIALIAMASDHQIGPNILSPLSLAYILDIGLDSQWNSLMQGIRLDSVWSIFLLATGIKQWTSFSNQKAWIIAVIPTLVVIVISLGFALSN